MKIETVPGTPETLGDSDGGLVVREVEFDPNFEFGERDYLRESLSPLANVIGKRSARFRFTTELKGSGDAGDVEPTWATALKGCQYDVTPSAGVSHLYTPGSTKTTLTIAIWRGDDSGNWQRQLISGAMGNWRLIAAIGDKANLEFDFFGALQPVVDGTPISPTLDESYPPIILGVPMTIGGFSAEPNTVTIDGGNDVRLPTRWSAASGYGVAFIGTRRPTLTADVEHVLVAQKDYFGNLGAGTLEQIIIGPVGTAAGNRWTVTIPKWQIQQAPGGNRDLLRVLNLTGLCIGNPNNNEIQLLLN